MYSATLGTRRYTFTDLKTLMAKATPPRSGDQLAALASESGEEVAAQYALADLPLKTFIDEHVIYEQDEDTGAGSSTATIARPSRPSRI